MGKGGEEAAEYNPKSKGEEGRRRRRRLSEEMGKASPKTMGTRLVGADIHSEEGGLKSIAWIF